MIPMKLRWFLSGVVREATEMCKQVAKLVDAQRDLLSPQAISGLDTAHAETQEAIRNRADKETLRKSMGKLEVAADKWLRPYPNAKWRENIEVFLVAIAVAMAIRTFFLQPFKIPTGSMQPTLYGIEFEPMQATPEKPAEEIPGFLGRVWDAAVRGTFYHFVQAESAGELARVDPPQKFLAFFNKQTVWLKYDGRNELTPHQIWFAPDPEQGSNQETKFLARAGLQPGLTFNAGDYVFRIKEVAGDHLFVDRVAYNFRPPTRGEIIVFKTKGINHPGMPQDQFYIKRLVALGGEKVSLGDDQHLRINDVRLDAATPHFGNVYTFGPDWKENHFFGHANDKVAREHLHYSIAPYFPDERTDYVVPDKHFMVMGDNTLRSFDSRGWGPFPRDNVIGKSFFVYWPIANHRESRFGWAHTTK